ncbi:hypothetical protein EDM57_14275 [Brevibacillus gelatini]|uniref:Uncharacterized protein n=1 Tax=Brevibacillus gelatini TaxID=1655277 RepID=A0A3M8AWX2_9BACL|nr:DUF6583 family protein [Brevibacillus gelatini]RNB55659.1 hypothetical protein EDM57_14275 [Brevibacillus gelatini]
METTTSVNPPRKSLKKPLLIAGAAAVVVLGGLGTAYAKFDLFKSPKTIYLQSEAESMLKFSSDISKAYGEYEDYMKPYLEKPVHSTTELSDITVDAALTDPQAQKVLELLKSAKIVVQSNIDEQKNQQQGNLEVHLKDKKLATMEFFLNDTQLGFRLPEFYSKYGYMDLKDRDVFKEKFGQELPKRFLTYRDLMKAVQISQDEVKSVLAPYALIYADSIQDSQVTLNKGVSFSEEGFQENAREITVTFTQEEAKALATKLAEKAKADEKLFDLIYTRYHNVATLLADSGYKVEEISKEEFKKNYEQSFDNLLKEIKDSATDSKEQLKMVVLVDGDHQILSRKLMFTGNDNKQEQPFFSSITYQKGADSLYRYALHNPEDPADGEVSYAFKATEQNGKTNGKLSLLVKNNEQPTFDLTSTIESVKEGQKSSGKYDFALVMADKYNQPMALNGNITFSETKTDNGRDSDSSVKVNFDNPLPDMPKGFSLKLKSKQEFGKALEIPAMTADNSVNLANLTEEQMMEIQQEAGTAAQKFMMENAELVQQFMQP